MNAVVDTKALLLVAGARGAADMLREQHANAAAAFVDQLAVAYERGYHIPPTLLGETMGCLLHASQLLSAEGYTGVSELLLKQYAQLSTIAGIDAGVKP